ncbi:hypothetical protein BR93DRAFT_964929 [Coniochaeta sp. PMI_546]|nr:hypothetical protein BR93DRAFT_964929 [Coniochaeta sp. PMI_546]
MHFTTSTTSLLLGLMGVWSCAAAPAEEVGLALPSTCTKKTACHTYTAYTAPSACPKIACPDLTGIMCPMYISITTSKVPCSTDCCPKTGTKTITTSCPTCPTGCVIPTATVTMTTGCKTTVTPIVTGTPGGPSVTLIPGGGDASVTLKPGRM